MNELLVAAAEATEESAVSRAEQEESRDLRTMLSLQPLCPSWLRN